MIEHISIPVKNYKKAKAFYTAVLKPLGYKHNMEYGKAGGFMEGGHTSFWIVEKPFRGSSHIAFHARSRKAVHDFHAAALKTGAKNNGSPGPRPDYSRDYYAAFIIDPDGHNIEAVTFARSTKKKSRR